MRQFDVCALRPRVVQSLPASLVVIMQDDALSVLTTRLVAPLLHGDTVIELPVLTPAFEVDGVAYRVGVQYVTAVSTRDLSRPVASLAEHAYALKRAIDRVFFGV